MDAKLLNTLKYELVRVAAELARQPAGVDQAVLKKLVLELRPALAEQRLPASYVQLLRELERAPRGQGNGAVAPRSAVEEARELLRGRALVLIGGIPRPDHQESLRVAFELSEVVWPPTSETKPTLTVLEPHIARADVAAVVLLIRWIRHALNDVADLCARHGKP